MCINKIGLEQVTYMLKDRMKVAHIKQGYEDTGQWLSNLDAVDGTGSNNYNIDPTCPQRYANFHQTMSKCTAVGGDRLSLAQYKQFEDALIPAIALYKAHGCITEDDMNGLNLINVTGGKIPKNDRPLHQQRALLMNAETTTAWYQSYKDRQLEKALAAGEKRRVAALKKIANAPMNKAISAYKKWFIQLPIDQQTAEAKGKRKATKAYKDQHQISLQIEYYIEAVNHQPHQIFQEGHMIALGPAVDEIEEGNADNDSEGSEDSSGYDENEDILQNINDFVDELENIND